MKQQQKRPNSTPTAYGFQRAVAESGFPGVVFNIGSGAGRFETDADRLENRKDMERENDRLKEELRRLRSQQADGPDSLPTSRTAAAVDRQQREFDRLAPAHRAGQQPRQPDAPWVARAAADEIDRQNEEIERLREELQQSRNSRGLDPAFVALAAAREADAAEWEFEQHLHDAEQAGTRAVLDAQRGPALPLSMSMVNATIRRTIQQLQTSGQLGRMFPGRGDRNKPGRGDHNKPERGDRNKRPRYGYLGNHPVGDMMKKNHLRVDKQSRYRGRGRGKRQGRDRDGEHVSRFDNSRDVRTTDPALHSELEERHRDPESAADADAAAQHTNREDQVMTDFESTFIAAHLPVPDDDDDLDRIRSPSRSRSGSRSGSRGRSRSK